jgi:hypothetical protein
MYCVIVGFLSKAPKLRANNFQGPKESTLKEIKMATIGM